MLKKEVISSNSVDKSMDNLQSVEILQNMIPYRRMSKVKEVFNPDTAQTDPVPRLLLEAYKTSSKVYEHSLEFLNAGVNSMSKSVVTISQTFRPIYFKVTSFDGFNRISLSVPGGAKTTDGANDSNVKLLFEPLRYRKWILASSQKEAEDLKKSKKNNYINPVCESAKICAMASFWLTVLTYPYGDENPAPFYKTFSKATLVEVDRTLSDGKMTKDYFRPALDNYKNPELLVQKAVTFLELVENVRSQNSYGFTDAEKSKMYAAIHDLNDACKAFKTKVEKVATIQEVVLAICGAYCSMYDSVPVYTDPVSAYNDPSTLIDDILPNDKVIKNAKIDVTSEYDMIPFCDNYDGRMFRTEKQKSLFSLVSQYYVTKMKSDMVYELRKAMQTSIRNLFSPDFVNENSVVQNSAAGMTIAKCLVDVALVPALSLNSQKIFFEKRSPLLERYVHLKIKYWIVTKGSLPPEGETLLKLFPFEDRYTEHLPSKETLANEIQSHEYAPRMESLLENLIACHHELFDCSSEEAVSLSFSKKTAFHGYSVFLTNNNTQVIGIGRIDDTPLLKSNLLPDYAVSVETSNDNNKIRRCVGKTFDVIRDEMPRSLDFLLRSNGFESLLMNDEIEQVAKNSSCYFYGNFARLDDFLKRAGIYVSIIYSAGSGNLFSVRYHQELRTIRPPVSGVAPDQLYFGVSKKFATSNDDWQVKSIVDPVFSDFSSLTIEQKLLTFHPTEVKWNEGMLLSDPEVRKILSSLMNIRQKNLSVPAYDVPEVTYTSESAKEDLFVRKQIPGTIHEMRHFLEIQNGLVPLVQERFAQILFPHNADLGKLALSLRGQVKMIPKFIDVEVKVPLQFFSEFYFHELEKGVQFKENEMHGSVYDSKFAPVTDKFAIVIGSGEKISFGSKLIDKLESNNEN